MDDPTIQQSFFVDEIRLLFHKFLDTGPLNGFPNSLPFASIPLLFKLFNRSAFTISFSSKQLVGLSYW